MPVMVRHLPLLQPFLCLNSYSCTQIDGPYGGAHSSMSHHTKVLLVGGGVGITFLIPQILSLLENPGHVRLVHLVWAIRSTGQCSVAFPPRNDLLIVFIHVIQIDSSACHLSLK